MSMPAMIGCIAVLAYSMILIEISYRSTKKADTVSSGKKIFLGNGLGTDRRICMLLSGEPVYETDSGGKKRYLYGTTSQNKSVQ